MGRKRRDKEKKRIERKKENLKGVPSPKAKEENFQKTELTAVDFLNIITRKHLKDLLENYQLMSYKNNISLKLPLLQQYRSCQELKKEVSRLDELKIGYCNACKANKILTVPVKKEKRNVNSSKSPEEDGTDADISGSNNTGEDEVLCNSHKINIKWFLAGIQYESVDFNVNRFIQIPSLCEKKRILESYFPNRYLQETLLSLKMSEERMINEDIKEKTVRILAFGMREERNLLLIYLTVPGIQAHDKEKIELRLTETAVTFYADDLNGKDYIFEMFNLANKVVPKTAKYEICDDLVTIFVPKRKLVFWKQLFNYKSQMKKVWEEEMLAVLKTQSKILQQQLEPLDFIWNVSLIFANCGTDFLNLPSDLNHLRRNFQTLEEMIFYYKALVTCNGTLKALIYILGGALCRKLMKSASSYNLKKSTKKRSSLTISEENKIMQEIDNLKVLWGNQFMEGLRLDCEGKFEEAYKLYADIPFAIDPRGNCLFEMKRFKEAFIYSIFAIRNLGPYYGFEAMITCLKYKLISGEAITAIDKAISLEYNNKQLNENGIRVLKTLRQNGLHFLNNIFKSYSLIFRKKFKDAIPFLEEAENIVLIKSGPTGVILLLLYFICKNYGKVIDLGKRILEDNTVYRDLIYYLLGMSSYYMNELSVAIDYLEKICSNKLEDLIRIRVIRNLINKADLHMQSKNLDAVADYYNKVLNLAKDNDQLLAHVLAKLRGLNLEKYEVSGERLTRLIDFIGEKKYVPSLRTSA